ncbi:hypothetical protein OPV22_003062 [Ensete ventricosum]|uniref:Bowman-Birk serine protease inhibitors family domain-containing protein n=1 Tax=Ensete ventricosum TaxID=4639 RepID=A0AAV8RZI0_ENSVE|nr:hypothetical protein OPV22_003062 [Ensete ventricosum]
MASSSTTFNACMPFSKSCGWFSIKWPDGWPNPSSPILHYCLTAEFETLTSSSSSSPAKVRNGEGVGGEKPWACCDMCLCTRSIPPQCRCTDELIGGCHPNCKNCLCTRSFPPKCYCRNIIYEDCGERCHP